MNKYGCVIEQAKNGWWQVNTHDRKHFRTRLGRWGSYEHCSQKVLHCGDFETESAAHAALDACKVAPPAWHTVTGEAVLKVLDALPEGVVVTVTQGIGDPSHTGIVFVWESGKNFVSTDGDVRKGNRWSITSLSFPLSALPTTFDRASIGVEPAKEADPVPPDAKRAELVDAVIDAGNELNQWRLDRGIDISEMGTTGSLLHYNVRRVCAASETLRAHDAAQMNTIDGSPAPIEQDGAKVSNQPAPVTREEHDRLRRDVDALTKNVTALMLSVDPHVMKASMEYVLAQPAARPRYEVHKACDDEQNCYAVKRLADGKFLFTQNMWVGDSLGATWFSLAIACAIADRLNREGE